MKVFVYSVSQINSYIKNIIENDSFLSDVFIEAEISNFKAHSSGHLYFTLKDEEAAISGVMYKSNALELKFLPKDGMKVIVYGYISLYKKTGRYQICVHFMEPSGKGVLYTAFEQLKNKLEAEGLFSLEHKKSIPKFPKCIAVITSSTGAAVRDIIRISHRRNSSIRIVIIPTIVQGDEAPKFICNSISIANKWKKADVIIIGRGGGSLEDLSAFNNESVARAIYNSKIPIISAVGHETDFTISDFVADLRASTPSAAAEIAVPLKNDIISYIKTEFEKIDYLMNSKLYEQKTTLKNTIDTDIFKQPLNIVKNRYSNILEINEEMFYILSDKIEKRKLYFKNLIGNVENLSPLSILKRGFSMTYLNSNKKIVSSIDDVKDGDIILTKVKSGIIKSSVIKKAGDYGEKKDF